MSARATLLLISILLSSSGLQAAQAPSREEVLQTLRKAAEFFNSRVSTQGGYHFYYTEDLSYGRSEQSEGPTRVEVQRQATPIVGMAYLEAYEASGERYYLEAARKTAHALVRGQLCSGGWDYFIEFDPDQRKNHQYRADGPCAGDGRREGRNTTTLDDNVTQAALRLLMRVDRELRFQDQKIHEAVRYALDQLSKAQYPNGAWPQRYSRFPEPDDFPVKRASYPESWPRTWPGPDYRTYYTFNDNSIVDMIDTLLEAARIYQEPRYRESAEKGGNFILLAQMPAPQPGWAQQYDRDMHPAWARRFEPPSITGGESQGVMKMLLLLYRETGDRKYLEPLARALDYYRRSALPQEENPSEIRARVCSPGTRHCLARFYELKTNRPLYITKGTRVSVAGRPSAILDGYELSYSDESVITHYSVLVRGDQLDEIAREYEAVLAADPAELKRPERLRGLSPWSRGMAPVGSGITGRPSLPDEELAGRVRTLIESMDERGAWVEEGRIGRADRIVSVFAAEEMVTTLGGQVFEMKENDTLNIYRGGEIPKERIIVSGTFAENIETLCTYLQRRPTPAATEPRP